MIPGSAHPIICQFEHFRGVAAAVSRIGIGKQVADIPASHGAQQGVRHGVQQHVGITVAQQMRAMRNVDPPKAQRTTRSQPVGVVSDANPLRARGAALSLIASRSPGPARDARRRSRILLNVAQNFNHECRTVLPRCHVATLPRVAVSRK
jgi:hypothetical protein